MRHPFLRTLAATPTDPNFENVTLLLHGDGTNGGQNNTFVDGSTNNFTITRNGNTTQGTFSPYGDNWSNYFDGTGDFLSTPDNAAFDFGTGDFTIEAWIYIAGNSALSAGSTRDAAILGCFPNSGTISNSYGLAISGSSTTTGTGLLFDSYQSGTRSVVSVTTTISQNTWHHIAVARSGTTTRLFLNGSEIGSGTLGNQTVNSAYNITIGRIAYSGYEGAFNGYISNLRVLKGTAQYTGSYTVPTAPLTAITNTSLLTCQSNRFRDASTNNFTITRNGDVSVQRFSPFSPTAAYAAGTIGGSGYFDGTGDYLSVGRNSVFVPIANEDFTIEAFVYLTATPGVQGGLIAGLGEYGTDSDWTFSINSSLQAVFYINTIATSFTNTTTALTLNTWNHVAVSRSGTSSNNLKVFVNGVGQSFTTNSTTVGNGNRALTIGADQDGDESRLTGYVSDIRIVKGSAAYTANFTPPTAPLTAITNTSLLLNFTNAAILDNAMMSDLETVGNAQISTSVKKYGTGSLYFDGTGDYLKILSSDTFVMGTGDFTVEFWIYIAARTGGGYVYATGTQTNDIFISFDSNGNFLRLTNQSTVFAVTGTISLTTWTHIAVVRSSGSSKIYVDGTGGTAVACTINFTATGPSVGASNTGVSPINGYIDDLRITKGVARYTANFTPPTAALPDL